MVLYFPNFLAYTSLCQSKEKHQGEIFQDYTEFCIFSIESLPKSTELYWFNIKIINSFSALYPILDFLWDFLWTANHLNSKLIIIKFYKHTINLKIPTYKVQILEMFNFHPYSGKIIKILLSIFSCLSDSPFMFLCQPFHVFLTVFTCLSDSLLMFWQSFQIWKSFQVCLIVLSCLSASFFFMFLWLIVILGFYTVIKDFFKLFLHFWNNPTAFRGKLWIHCTCFKLIRVQAGLWQ